MSIRLELELPEAAFSVLRVTPEEFLKEVRLAAAVKWYEMRMISQSKAAEVCQVSRVEFLDALNRYHVSPFQVSEEDMEGEVALLEKMRKLA